MNTIEVVLPKHCGRCSRNLPQASNPLTTEGEPRRHQVTEIPALKAHISYACATAGRDRGSLWTTIDGADRLLGGGSADCRGGWWKRCWPVCWALRSVWEVRRKPGKKSAKRSNSPARTAGAVAARSGPECGRDGLAHRGRQALDLGHGRPSGCVLRGGLHARRQSAGDLAPFSAAFFAVTGGWFI